MVMNVSTSALTPEAARGLAADLAPHLLAMRAVTAGTRYADADLAAGPAVSPATKIFIAGMLDRMSAPTWPDGARGAGRRDAATCAAALVSPEAGIDGC
jgi:hypothetical protein